jgi:hypothetical protein
MVGRALEGGPSAQRDRRPPARRLPAIPPTGRIYRINQVGGSGTGAAPYAVRFQSPPVQPCVRTLTTGGPTSGAHVMRHSCYQSARRYRLRPANVSGQRDVGRSPSAWRTLEGGPIPPSALRLTPRRGSYRVPPGRRSADQHPWEAAGPRSSPLGRRFRCAAGARARCRDR